MCTPTQTHKSVRGPTLCSPKLGMTPHTRQPQQTHPPQSVHMRDALRRRDERASRPGGDRRACGHGKEKT